jgi:2-oxoglutarate ferredoxin oxidoreductase subunit alpha
MDECVGHMTERVVIPEPEEIEVVPRRLTERSPGEFQPYRLNGGKVPEFARAGDGYRFHATGLTHDERGYPVMSTECQEQCVRRLLEKITDNVDDILHFEEEETEGADVVVVTYGITARVARMGIDMARKRGIRVGSLRMVVIWPFAEKRIRQLAENVGAIVVPEINCGQLVLEVERCAAGKCGVWPVPHAGGSVHDPADIAEAIIKAAP